jgi:hypothetical protein
LKRRLYSIPACALLALLVSVPIARAGTYDVYGCWAGSDSFRNPGANASAWGKTGDPGGRYGAFDQCGGSDNGLGVIAYSGYPAPNGASAEVSFGAPAGTRIERLRMWRTAWSYGQGSGGASQRSYLYLLADGQAGRGDQFDGSADVPLGAAGSSDVANHGLIPANQLDVDLASSTPTSIAYRVGCRFDAGCPTADGSGSFAAGVKIYGTQVTLRDSSEPALAVAATGLLAAGVHRGREIVRVSTATDNLGIKRLAVYADDSTSPVGVVDYERNPDRCAWWRPVPCAGVSDVDVAVDTLRVPDGQHRFVVRAYDAAENVHSFVSEPVTIKNGADAKPDSFGTAVPVLRGALNGVGASDSAVLTAFFSRSRTARLSARFSRRAVVSGRLLDEAGRPIAGAEVAVAGRVRRGAVRALGVTHTGADGRYRFTLPARRPSRQLFVSYRSHAGDPTPVATRSLSLKVAAGVRLGVGPGHVRNGQAITFRGALLGRPVPSSGKLIDMQVKVGRRWQTFATTRARGRRASFTYRYRFTRTTARITYRFRALARAESAYPYATGASRTVKVRVN